MNKEDIKRKFEEIHQCSEYIRVSETHPLELYIGKNEDGYLTLRFNDKFLPIKVVGNAILEIKQVKTTNYNSLLFCFNSRENLSLFYGFCEDIINQTQNCEYSNGYTAIVNRYNQWKKMFSSSSTLLKESEIIGLIGELLFLKDFALEKYGETVGLSGWSGPEPTHKDFSYENMWYEIKTINTSRQSINISSIEQLDSDSEGKLVVYSIEKMSPSYNGITLNELVLQINNSLKLDENRDIFFEKLKQIKYSYNEVYDNYVYENHGCNFYVVSNEFPRLKTANLPKGIGKIQYEIMLSHIEQYKEK